MEISVSEPKTISFDEEVYSSFPDVVRIPDTNEIFCVFREGDTHHPSESKLILMSTDNEGAHWEKSIFQKASLSENGYVFNCPRINYVNNRLAIVCDTKTSQDEGEAKWKICGWWSNNYGKDWSDCQDLGIPGVVPDHFVEIGSRLVMGYHVPEATKLIVTGSGVRKRFVQMMAESLDEGETWRDRTTIAISTKHSFCEGSIVNTGKNRLLCYMRDNRSCNLRSHLVYSIDAGRTWSKTIALDIKAHRIVADVKKREPYAGAIIGTYRNTAYKTVSLFVHNLKNQKTQNFVLDSETNVGGRSVFDFGYSGWVELDDGSLIVLYYITRHYAMPQICMVKVKFS